MPVKNGAEEAVTKSLTVPKEEYDKVVANNEKLVNAFNKLLKLYNDLFVNSLFTDTENQ